MKYNHEKVKRHEKKLRECPFCGNNYIQVLYSELRMVGLLQRVQRANKSVLCIHKEYSVDVEQKE